MPKILINERDLTTVVADNITDNIVYIPGYAITGPINTPTLCYTLEEFKNIFGELPYKFKNSYSYTMFASEAQPTGNFILAEDYEKSYIYACELLRNGLPILYERVVSEDNKFIASTSFGSLIVKAKYYGSYGNNIQCKLTAKSTDENNNDYILEVKIDKNNIGIKAISPIIYNISLDPTSSDYIDKFKSSYVDLILEEGDIQVTADYKSLAITALETEDEFTPEMMYTAMYTDSNDSIFTKLEDKGQYQIKFITSGAYPVFEYDENKITTEMLTIAGKRGDCVALIDHTNKLDRSFTGDNSIYAAVNELENIDIGSVNNPDNALRYGAMFTPYASYRISTLDNRTEILPASFAYLNSLAVSVQTNANWYAVAGVTRGLVPNLLQLSQNVTGAIAQDLQPETGISINPITNIKPYGYCIWGNRTLNTNEKGLIASSFLNIRVLANDVKKVVYTAAKKLTFELNTDVLWLNFKSEIEPTLDKMVSGNGLTGYRILRKATTKRATIEAIIRLFVVEAVEDWDITIELSDTTVSVQ